jgi:hypothetical protein
VKYTLACRPQDRCSDTPHVQTVPPNLVNIRSVAKRLPWRRNSLRPTTHLGRDYGGRQLTPPAAWRELPGGASPPQPDDFPASFTRGDAAHLDPIPHPLVSLLNPSQMAEMDFCASPIASESGHSYPGSEPSYDGDHYRSNTWPEDAWNDDIQTAVELIRAPVDRKPTKFYPSPPLGLKPRETRLLRLLPGQPEDVVRCSLAICSLSDDPSYEALSYTWGNSDEKLEVEVNGYMMPVTDNLGHALRRLRYTERARVLWIDALCINQNASDERNHQVAFMADIYRSASTVLVWLGDAHLERNISDAHGPLLHRRDSVPSLWREEDRLIRSFEQATSSVFFRWWKRVWTVQEFVVASEEPVICFANYSLKLTDLDITTIDTVNAKEFRIALQDLAEMRSLYIAGGIAFQQAFILTAAFTASDPRDKCYGLLGLLRDQDSDVLQPDYSRAEDYAFARATSIFVNADRRLIYLAAVHVGGDRRKMPSWAIGLAYLSPESIRTGLKPGAAEHRVNWLRAGENFSRPLISSETQLPVITDDYVTLRCAGYRISEIFCDLSSDTIVRRSEQVEQAIADRINRPLSALEQSTIAGWFDEIPQSPYPSTDRPPSVDEATALILGGFDATRTDIGSLLASRFRRVLESARTVRANANLMDCLRDELQQLLSSKEHNDGPVIRYSLDCIGKSLREMCFAMCLPGYLPADLNAWNDYVCIANEPASLTTGVVFSTRSGDLGIGLQVLKEEDIIAVLLPDRFPVALTPVRGLTGRTQYRFKGFVYMPCLRGMDLDGRELKQFEIF